MAGSAFHDHQQKPCLGAGLGDLMLLPSKSLKFPLVDEKRGV